MLRNVCLRLEALNVIPGTSLWPPTPPGMNSSGGLQALPSSPPSGAGQLSGGSAQLLGPEHFQGRPPDEENHDSPIFGEWVLGWLQWFSLCSNQLDSIFAVRVQFNQGECKGYPFHHSEFSGN